MSKTRRQHIIPRIYLKQFTTDGKRTYAYIRKLNTSKLLSIKDVGVKEHFYTVKHNILTPEHIEFQLSSKAEPLLGQCISSIIRYTETQQERLNLSDICRALICQYYRGVDFRKEINLITSIRVSLLHSLFSIDHRHYESLKNINAPMAHAYETFLNESLIASRIKNILDYGEWSIMVSNQHHFITSDRPVLSFCIIDKNEKKVYTKTDIGTPSSYIIMTITPNILLQIRLHSSIQISIESIYHIPIVDAGADYVKSINHLQLLNYDQQLYSKSPFNLQDII